MRNDKGKQSKKWKKRQRERGGQGGVEREKGKDENIKREKEESQRKKGIRGATIQKECQKRKDEKRE